MRENSSVHNRIKRVKGQIEGIEKMLENERNCLEIVQQIVAARSALASIGREVLKGEAVSCSRNPEGEDFEEVIDKLFKLT